MRNDKHIGLLFLSPYSQTIVCLASIEDAEESRKREHLSNDSG